MNKHVMKVHPFYEVAKAAEAEVVAGNTVHQQFNCAKCGVKQTMEDKNKFFMTGRCEECGHVSDLVADGCNFMVIKRMSK